MYASSNESRTYMMPADPSWVKYIVRRITWDSWTHEVINDEVVTEINRSNPREAEDFWTRKLDGGPRAILTGFLYLPGNLLGRCLMAVRQIVLTRGYTSILRW